MAVPVQFLPWGGREGSVTWRGQWGRRVMAALKVTGPPHGVQEGPGPGPGAEILIGGSRARYVVSDLAHDDLQLLGEHCSCRKLGVWVALACTSLCFCCDALVVGCGSYPLTLARLCPCDCCPGPFYLQCLSALLAAFPQVPSLAAVAQPGPAPACAGFPCLPPSVASG